MKPDNIIPLNSDKPVRADAARNRRLLLDTAINLFNTIGIEEVTMSAIAQEAGVGKGTLYRHFADKAELCHALLDEDMREFQYATLAQIRNSPDPIKSLQWFLEHAAKYVVDHNELLIEAAKLSGVNMLSHPAHIWWRQTINGLLARLNLDEDISYIADMLYIMLDVQTIRFQRRVLGYEVERIVGGLHMLLRRMTRADD